MSRRHLQLCVVCVFASTSASVLAATTPSGTAIAVIQSSQADGETGKRTLAPAAPVYSGDRIITGNVGEAQLRFRDGTKLVVGPNSSMVLDSFVLNANNTASDVAINAVRGAFRFISGNGPQDAYSITTPTATISVRGTALDLNVDRFGNTRTAVFDGGIINCDRLVPPARTCVFQTATDCAIIVTETTVRPRVLVSTEERRREVENYFPYIRSQSTLVADFRLDVDSCGVTPIAPVSPPTPVEETLTIMAVVPGPPPPPPPPPDDDRCTGNCGTGQGNGGGNGTGNEGNGKGPNK